ncbi:CD109 antigen [Megalops cyprinoides]|uniref:CD109 antigen n=1 Tax=Megalops cyprinoides TaxID=118141 RepID=UPI001864AC8C|nr:CD109 antigen [Megalops cyprinoides]
MGKKHGLYKASPEVTVLNRSAVRVTAEIVNGNTSVIPDSAVSYWNPYQLVVNGYVGDSVVFTNKTFLRFNPKSFSTFIQTDKDIYSPGQMVKIRAVSIYPDGRPYKSKVNISIKDPKGNTIQQWQALEGFLGVVSREFQLSENPPLGIWSIEASVDEVLTEEEFTVDYHVLPKFEVQIKAPSVIHYEDDLIGTVNAQYMYGKPVRGTLTMTVEFEFFGMHMSINKTMEISGSADFIFSDSDFYDSHGYVKRSVDSMYNENEITVYLTACVTETLTGLKYNTTTEVTVVENRYRLTFHEYPSVLKPSLNFSAQVKVCSYTGEPLTPQDLQQTVTLTVTQHKYSPWTWRPALWEELRPRMDNSSQPEPQPTDSAQTHPYPLPGLADMPTAHTITLPVPADGVVPFEFQLSDDVATLTIQAEFRDSHETLELYRGYSSPRKSYIQIRRDSSPSQVGVPLQLTVQSNFPLTEFQYVVMSRGQVVAAGRKSSASFSLTPEESWAPLACLVVYIVFPDGEIANDAIRIPIVQVLKNSVSLSWSQPTAKPAEEVALTVSVQEPGSLVGILVVDKATKATENDNDITEEECCLWLRGGNISDFWGAWLSQVLEELSEFNMDKVNIPQGKMVKGDPYSIFTSCNLMVLTDASLFEMQDLTEPEFPGEGIHLLQQFEEMSPPPRVRREFPQTWLWLDTNVSDSTITSLPLTVPDSITSWIATAFVVSDSLGLGLVSAPAKLTVLQDFFLSLNLPAYIIRGEQLVLEVNLFNYLQEDLEVMVIVAQSESFEFVSPDNEGISMASVQRVVVRSQDSSSVLFPIRPTILGEMPISVKALSTISSDAVVQKVLVKPEGIEQSFTKSLFLELPPAEHHLSREILFTFPPDVVPGSERVEVAVVGDILGPSITGLDSLIQMPYGCGEQNMIHFAPNIYVLQYLTRMEQVKPEIRSKAISFMMEGYQRELSYQRDDGSFSAFGDSDPSGSTWLSAFVLRCFLQARPFIAIDPGVLIRTASWLVGQQGPDGAFTEPGRVIHTELQGGLDGPVALTAYALMALLEDQTYMNMYSSKVSSALLFLEGKLQSGISSNYSLCLVTYALSLANRSSADTALRELMRRADVHDGVASWRSSNARLTDSWQPRSADIEMAAYVLLSMFKQAKVEDGLPLMKWLSQQRNHLGGYGSTQDTIIALQALSWYAAFSGSGAIDLSVDVVIPPSSTVASFQIDSTNYLLRQSQEFEAQRNIHIEVSAEGRGFALFQLNVFYNLESGEPSRRRRDTAGQDAFDLTVEVMDDEGDTDHITIVICTRYASILGIPQTGMALMEVGLLSGFSLAEGGIPTGDLIRRVETPPGKVILYLDSVTTSQVCIRIPTVRDFKVAHVQDAVVLIYDYYEPRRRAVRTYNSEVMRGMSTCSFCGDDCSQCGGSYVWTSNSPSVTQSLHHAVSVLVVALLLTFIF